jgi:hypothetical protein
MRTTSVWAMLTLLLVGCATPHGNLMIGQPKSYIRVYGYVVNPDAWRCQQIDDQYGQCAECLNISGKPQELLTGYASATGVTVESAQRYRPGAMVWVCEMPMRQMAQRLLP